MNEELITKDALNAVVGAYCDDIFSILGMHQLVDGSLVVRCFLPDAKSVSVISSSDKRKVAELESVHPAGVYAGKMGNRKNRFTYFLRVEYEGATIDIEDPYRFPVMIDDNNLYLFCEGTQEKSHNFMGAHQVTSEGVNGVCFTVWAPDARRASVIGDFNHWDGRRHVMRKHLGSGIWEIFIPGVKTGDRYKFEMLDHYGNMLPLKADPFAFEMEHPPATASKVAAPLSGDWQDKSWVKGRQKHNWRASPVTIYEVHLGSWRRNPMEGNRYLTYRELASELVPYVKEMGFSHIQLMPVTEYPFDGSWGYQPIGMFAPTSRFGSPEDFKFFVEACHAEGIGVLLDWVPGHFPTDEHGLGRFDGTSLFEHADVRQGFHPDWNTLIYNYGRKEVISFLLSNALFWLEEFHLDGLRFDAVASMLYLDYSREGDAWVPNAYGGRENLEAIELLKQVNRRAYFNFPGILMIAEESTAWPGISQPIESGGLGFGFKWNMGWMNDTLKYMERDPIHRKYHHNQMTFGLVYAFSENFILPLSHDEVVHGKGSLLDKMPGDRWQKFANLRAYYGFMWTHPGKKLLFMGGEFGQSDEWNHNQSLDWHLLDYPEHKGVKALIKDLNALYTNTPALHQLDCEGRGFEWIQTDNAHLSVFCWLRKGEEGAAPVVIISNMTPTVHTDFPLGVPHAGFYREIMNTDDTKYAGSGVNNGEGVTAAKKPWDGRPYSLSVTLPPLATIVLQLDM